MVVRKLEIPPHQFPVVLNSIRSSSWRGGTPRDASRMRHEATTIFQSVVPLPFAGAMHTCAAKRTLYVSLGNRRCSSLRSLSPSLAIPSALWRRFSLELESEQRYSVPKKREKRKKGNYRESRRRSGCLISAYKKDIPRADSSRFVFIPF